MDSIKGKRKQQNYVMPMNYMNDSEQKAFRSLNINVINGLYLNQNSNLNQNALYDGRKKRFINNKGISNYNSNTINVTKFKNNMQFNNKVITNLDIINRNKSLQNYQYNQKINYYNYFTYNNPNVNFANLIIITNGYNVNENMPTYLGRYTSPNQTKKIPIAPNNKLLEIATVTKIFSSKDDILNKDNNKNVNAKILCSF